MPAWTETGINYIIITTKDAAAGTYLRAQTNGNVSQLHSNATKNFQVWLWEDCTDADIAALQGQPFVIYSSSVYIGQTPA